MGSKTYFNWKNAHKSHKYVDYSAVAIFEEPSLSIAGLDSMELTVGIPPLPSTVTWSGLTITSALTGKTITVSGSGMSVSEGDVLYLKNVDHPIRDNKTLSLRASAPSRSSVKKFGNLFIGAVVDGALLLRSQGSQGSVPPLTFKEYSFIPIAAAEDGAVPPAAVAVVTSGNGSISAREFGGAAGDTVHDVVVPWEVPEDITAGEGIKFTVVGVLSDVTGITTENVSFKLSGYSVGNSDSISGTFGTEVEVNIPTTTYSQYDRFKSNQSSTVTVTSLVAGETAFLHFERDTADVSDNYLKPIGVAGIIIESTREPDQS